MVRSVLFSFLLVVSLLLACAPSSSTESAPQPAAPTRLLPTPAPSKYFANPEEPLPTAGTTTASGVFDLKNTSTDMAEVLVESMEMVFEIQVGQAAAWQSLVADCDFDPTVPVLVRDSQTVRYDCQFKHAVPPDAELRATVEIRLLGSDQLFRLQVYQ